MSTESKGQTSPVGNLSVIKGLCDLELLDRIERSLPKTDSSAEIAEFMVRDVCACRGVLVGSTSMSSELSIASCCPSDVQTMSRVVESAVVLLRTTPSVFGRGLISEGL